LTTSVYLEQLGQYLAAKSACARPSSKAKKNHLPHRRPAKKLVVALAAINSEQALSLWRLSYLPKNKKSS
jgi:hypothetical protein